MMNWIKRLFKKNNNQDWTVIEQGGQTSFVSSEIMKYFKSKLPNPSPNDLSSLIEDTVKIIISERIVEVGKDELKSLLVIEDKEVIKIAGQNFEILDEPKGHLIDNGCFIFDFVTKNGEKSQIEYFGVGLIRWVKKWKEDAGLKNPLTFLEWLKNLMA